MDMSDTRLAYPKPEPRKRVMARAKRTHAEFVSEIRTYVFGRERGICRCCRVRRAESMHELRPKSLGGRVSRRNSIAVCGSGTTGCHGHLQQHQVVYGAGQSGAEDVLIFTAMTQLAADHMRVELYKTIVSPPMREVDVEAR